MSSSSIYTNLRRIIPMVALAALAVSSTGMNAGAASMPNGQGFIDQLFNKENAASLVSAALLEANRSFISQYPSRFNPRARWGNNNCGPTCLAMAVKYFGNGGGLLNDDPQARVNKARLDMTGTLDNRLTGMHDVMRGAAKDGLSSRVVKSLTEIDGGLLNGQLAVVSGSPSVATSYGVRLPYAHSHFGHFILITRKIGNEGYILADPESLNGAYAITRPELDGFLSYYSLQHPLRGAVMLGS